MDKLSLSLFNSPSMKLEDFRELSATALSLKNCEEYEDGSTQNKWLSFFFDSA